jgi:hypothetical protein
MVTEVLPWFGADGEGQETTWKPPVEEETFFRGGEVLLTRCLFVAK